MISSELILFILKIIFNKFKSKTKDPAGCVKLILSLIRSKFFSLHAVPESFILKVNNNVFSNNVLIINGPRALKWYKVYFKTEDNICCRNVQICFSPEVPRGSMICSDTLLFNIKKSLLLLPCDKLSCDIFIKCINIEFNTAKSIKVNLIEGQENLDCLFLEKSIECYLNKNQFVYLNDVISIDLDVYSPYHCNKFLYLVVGEATGDDLVDHGFLVTRDTSAYQGTAVKSFIPALTYQMLDISNLSTLSTVIPCGLEKHFSVLFKWFKPFFKNTITELKPVMMLSGVSGVGKKLVLECTARKLGVHYHGVDCNDLIASSTAQVQANFKNAFNKIIKVSPAIVEFYNVELMCYETDSNDINQTLWIFSDHINTLDFKSNSLAIVITCMDVTLLPDTLTRLVLAHHHMSLPTLDERISILSWLVHRYDVSLSQNLLDYIAKETASYTFADLKRLLAVSDFNRYKSNRTTFLKDDFTSAFDSLSKVDKANVGEIEWQDVGGIDHIKKAVLSSIQTGKAGGLRRTGILLHGPPGTGKTLLARAVANQVSAAFIPVKGPELLNMYIGQSEANVRQVFSRARDAAPCILFFDELDSLAPSRGNQSSGGVMDRVVSQLLSEMDSLEVEDDVFVLAATNRPDLIDPALLRPGRLDKMIYVGPFTESRDKIKLLKAITRKFELEEGFDYNKIVKYLPEEVTGAQVNAMCYQAWNHSASQIIKNGLISENSRVIVGEENFISSMSSSNVHF